MTVLSVIFDMDGTLVDSQAHIVHMMQSLFEEKGLPSPSPQDVRHTIGLSLADAMRVLMPDADAEVWQNMAVQYKQAYRAWVQTEAHQPESLYPETIELLAALSIRPVTCSVATGKSFRGVNRVFGIHGIGRYFSSVQTADTHPSKPNPSMIEEILSGSYIPKSRTLMIGDTTFDMEMAKNAGVVAVGVSWGYHSVDHLRASGADKIVETWSELLDYVDEEIGMHT